MRMITVTDTIGGASATVESFDVAETISAWYPEASEEIGVALDQLQIAINTGEPTGELEAYLGIRLR